MARSIFANQDSQYLEHLCQASIVLDREPNRLFLQVWASSGLPRGWLGMVAFEVSDDEGHVASCRGEYLGTNLGAECFNLSPLDPETDLAGMFTVPGDDYCLSIQFIDVVTIDGARKRLSNDAKSLKSFACADITFLHPKDFSSGH